MNIIFIGKRGRQTRTLKLGSPRVILGATLALTIIPSLMFYGGYFTATQATPNQEKALLTVWQGEMDVQREEIATARQKVDADIDALALRLGELQARVIRLDALGGRLTEIAKLDRGEFDFSSVPAVGGPESTAAVDSISVPGFVASLESLSKQVDDRSAQLGLLETMLMSRNLEDEVSPAGRPIKRGWISSYYGMRTDPFTGRREHHKGMDLAGKEGSEVISVGAGVVTWAGDRYGYGKLVEVNHGNGYATRYGHSKEVLVQVGDAVKKGQTLALMGSTGRSTGPHVHFEVLYKGKAVDPKKYILAAR
ncbi:MAG: M23 family metallopeptidase [Gammaproteobacteria bacterium]|nr:M23 family metallopeptidase [Gammaproteobacteria bacterium]MCF6259136.1 M23 family metallopeptidase [Gammaproteobacteria bacterium]